MIRFSKKEDYAIILINKLVQNYNKRLVPLSEVSNEYKISPLFLRNLASQLKRDGIVKAVEGKKGGYFLSIEPSRLKVGDVLSVFSKKPMLDCCPLESLKQTSIKCPKEDICQPGFIWRKLNKNFLEKIYSLNLIEFFNYDDN
ncbi:MAG: Rrf2 family transcriptional regulator [bacterium]|nr:Rrf2 family transcriptional regulator [bacterium]